MCQQSESLCYPGCCLSPSPTSFSPHNTKCWNLFKLYYLTLREFISSDENIHIALCSLNDQSSFGDVRSNRFEECPFMTPFDSKKLGNQDPFARLFIFPHPIFQSF